MNNFDNFYENVLFSLKRDDIVFENFNDDVDLSQKYKNLLEARNMVLHLKGNDCEIIFFNYFDRDIRQSQDYENRVTEKVKPYEEALLKDLRTFLQNNILITQATHNDLEVGSYPFTYTVYLKYQVQNEQEAEEVLREAIKMYDKIYRFMRKRIHALKVF